MPAAHSGFISEPLYPPSEHPVETKDVWETLRPKHPVMLSDPAPGVAGRMLPSGHGPQENVAGAELSLWAPGHQGPCVSVSWPLPRRTVLAEHAARRQTPGSRLATSPQRAHVLGRGARVGSGLFGRATGPLLSIPAPPGSLEGP